MPGYLLGLMKVYLRYYSSHSPLKSQETTYPETEQLARKILRYFGIETDLYTETWTWQELVIPFSAVDGTMEFRIIPKNLSWSELQGLKELLNNHKDVALKMNPLLEVLGWVLTAKEDGVEPHFFGGPNTLTWKETWDLDQSDDELNWKDLPEAPDGWSKEKIEKKKKNWLS